MFTVLQALKVPDLSLDIVLSLEIGAVVVASRCLLRRPSTGIALPAERNSALTVDGVQKHPAKGLCEPVCRVWPDSLGHE